MKIQFIKPLVAFLKDMLEKNLIHQQERTI